MAFRLADVKKTVRSRSDGGRYLHPKLLDPAVAAAQVSLALAYMQSRLGRARRDVDPEMLVRFFGDPKVARGLVACLAASYRWRTQDFAEILGPKELAHLSARGLHTPSDLRLYLYDRVNREHHGYLPADRDEHLAPLARRLHLTASKLDQLVALDAEENAVLVRVGPIPEPEHVVALYNFNAVDAILRHSVCVELDDVDLHARARLEEACAAHGVRYEWTGSAAVLHNKADLFGSFARGGIRLTRALYAAASAAPALLTRGRARVHGAGKSSTYLLGKETLSALTGGAGAIRYAVTRAEFREDWGRHRARHSTSGWRLVTAPEPVLSSAGLVLAPFAVVRDEARVTLWPATSSATTHDLLALHAAGLDALAIAAGEQASVLPADLPYALSVDGAGGIIAALDARWNDGRVPVDAQALEALLAEVEARGFVPEESVVAALGCADIGELPGRLRKLDSTRALYVPGMGVCSPIFAEGMRKGLRRRNHRRQRQPAA